MGRVVAWKISTLIALDHPLTGGGFDAVAQPKIWYHYLEHLPEVNFISTPDIPPFPLVAHSIYFEVLGDLGFPGLILFLSILGMSIFNCGKIRRQARGRPELEWAGDLARMLQISMVVYAVSGAALSFAYSETYWILVAIISRLSRTIQDAVRESDAAIPVQNIATVPAPSFIHAGAARADSSL
jgi:probable O-glycosylation ligase (exosortase A-associated)